MIAFLKRIRLSKKNFTNTSADFIANYTFAVDNCCSSYLILSSICYMLNIVIYPTVYPEREFFFYPSEAGWKLLEALSFTDFETNCRS